MIEQETTVSLHIPPMVRDRTIIEAPNPRARNSQPFFTPPHSNLQLIQTKTGE
jgi:hypothetical protein